jgi:hypothetical protein
MSASIMQTMIWVSAAGILLLFMKRRRGRKTTR